MTRRGKIARLPRVLRDELNQRIEDGETGARLVEWLNGREDVQAAMKIHFGGNPINEQNVSDWRAGGYADWQEQQSTFELANGILDESAERKDLVTDGRLADHVGDMAALMLAKMIRALRRMEDGPEQWETALKIVREVVRLRKSDREFEEALRRRETHERYETLELIREQIRAKSPSERLEEILAERRREVGAENGGQRTENGAGTEDWSEDGESEDWSEDGEPGETVDGGTEDGAGPEDREQRTEPAKTGKDGAGTEDGESVSPPEADKPAQAGEAVDGETVDGEAVDGVAGSVPPDSPRGGGAAAPAGAAGSGDPALQGGAPQDDPRGEGAAAPSPSGPAVAAASQESSRFIKVDQKSRRRGRGVPQWMIVNRRR